MNIEYYDYLNCKTYDHLYEAAHSLSRGCTKILQIDAMLLTPAVREIVLEILPLAKRLEPAAKSLEANLGIS